MWSGKVWVVVEHDTDVDYGEDGAYSYKVVGNVHGPFDTEDEADKWSRKQARGPYQPNYEVREIKPVLRSSTP